MLALACNSVLAIQRDNLHTSMELVAYNTLYFVFAVKIEFESFLISGFNKV